MSPIEIEFDLPYPEEPVYEKITCHKCYHLCTYVFIRVIYPLRTDAYCSPQCWYAAHPEVK